MSRFATHNVFCSTTQTCNAQKLPKEMCCIPHWSVDLFDNERRPVSRHDGKQLRNGEKQTEHQSKDKKGSRPFRLRPSALTLPPNTKCQCDGEGGGSGWVPGGAGRQRSPTRTALRSGGQSTAKLENCQSGLGCSYFVKIRILTFEKKIHNSWDPHKTCGTIHLCVNFYQIF